MHKQELLIRSSEIVKRHDELARKHGEKFNIFNVLDRATNEVKGHSAFIAELLNPNGTHGQGCLYLNELFVALRKSEVPALSDFPTDAEQQKWQVRKELSSDYGRMDIVVESQTTLLIIENKVGTTDFGDQLLRYWNYGCEKKLNTFLIYLTPDGSDPQAFLDSNLPEEAKNRIAPLSYAEFLSDWIEQCILVSAEKPFIRESLRQYRLLIASNEDMVMEVTNLLEEPEDITAALEIVKALTKKKIMIQSEFWQLLQGGLSEIGLKPADLLPWFSWSPEKVEHYYKRGRNRKYFGLAYSLVQLDQDINLTFTVALYNDIYYGFSAAIEQKHVGQGLNLPKPDKLLAAVKKTSANAESVGFIGWKYPAKRLYFDCFDESCIRLADSGVLDETVEAICSDIESILKTFWENYSKTKDAQ